MELSLPAVARAETLGVRAACVGFVVWGLVLLLVYLVPAIWEATVALADVVLWPLIRSCGRWWGVVVISLLTAFTTIGCQWLCTGVRRLREVKGRLLELADAFKQTARDSPEEEAIAHIIRQGEWRIARAALVPLGLLLGPVLVSFSWLPVRVEPQYINPAPGEPLTMAVRLDADYAGPLSVRVEGGALPDGVAEATMEVASVREALESLRRELVLTEGGMPQTATVREHLVITGKSVAEAREALDKELAEPLSSRTVQWSLTPTVKRAAEIVVQVEGGTRGRGTLAMSIGDDRPPPLELQMEKGARVLTRPGSGVVHDLRVSFADPRPAGDRAFWRPFAALGWMWDAGWLGLYLVAYVPAMFLFKKLFRIP
jgi:hypothetical protein